MPPLSIPPPAVLMLFNPRMVPIFTEDTLVHPLRWFMAFKPALMDDHLPAPPAGAAPAAAGPQSPAEGEGARAGAGEEPPAQRPRRG
jgi:hypothetical protein